MPPAHRYLERRLLLSKQILAKSSPQSPTIPANICLLSCGRIFVDMVDGGSCFPEVMPKTVRKGVCHLVVTLAFLNEVINQANAIAFPHG